MSERVKYEYKDIQQVDFSWIVPDNGFTWNEEAEPVKKSLFQYPDSDGNLAAPKLTPSEIPGLHETLEDALSNPDREQAVRDVFRVTKGHEVLSVPQVDGPFLIEAPGTTDYYRHNRLLQDETMMFILFAETSPDRQGILDLANKYGMLTRGETQVRTPLYQEGQGPKGPFVTKVNTNETYYYAVPAESLSFWKREIIDMWRLFKVWDWWKQARDHGDYSSLRRVIKWKDDTSAVLYTLPSWDSESLEYTPGERQDIPPDLSVGNLADKDNNRPEIFKRFKRNSLLLPAQYLVQRLVNEKLQKLEQKGIATIRPRLLMNIKNKTEPYLVPSNLLAALWLQLYQAVCGERPYKRCEVCGAWEDVSMLLNSKGKPLQRPSRWRGHANCLNAKYQREWRERDKVKSDGRA